VLLLPLSGNAEHLGFAHSPTVAAAAGRRIGRGGDNHLDRKALIQDYQRADKVIVGLVRLMKEGL